MAILGKDILKKMKKNDHLIHLKMELKRILNQLKVHVIYGQRLLHIGSWTYDMQKGEVIRTEEVYHILECSSQRLDGRLESFYPYVHPDDREKVKEVVQGALVGKEYDIEYRIVTPGGTEKYVYEKVKILLDEKKNPIKMIGTIQDITECKVIGQDLKAFGENLNRVQKVIGAGSGKYDAVKDEIFWPEEIYRIFGIDPINFKKDFNSLLELVHPRTGLSCKTQWIDAWQGKAIKLNTVFPNMTARKNLS